MDSQPSNTDSAGRALILVVERSAAVQMLERFLLEQAGYLVEFADDGMAALERTRELRPKLVVTELLVPKLDGLGLCRALKSDPQTNSIVILMISHLHAQDRAVEAGADAFLMKPIDEELLTETVARLLDIRAKGA
jgi:CheY-like chemotaxis protein